MCDDAQRARLRAIRDRIRRRPPNYWRIAGGSVLAVLGIAGLVLPVLQGGLLLMLALLVLSADIRVARWVRLKIERRYPVLRRAVRRGRSWFQRWIPAHRRRLGHTPREVQQVEHGG